MAELVDAQDSKSCGRKAMRVQFPLAAPSLHDKAALMIRRLFFFIRAIIPGVCDLLLNPICGK